MHAGGQSGVSSILMYLPEHGAAVAILCNLEQSRIQELADQILRIVTEPQLSR
jgi:hypothetical protein